MTKFAGIFNWLVLSLCLSHCTQNDHETVNTNHNQNGGQNSSGQPPSEQEPSGEGGGMGPGGVIVPGFGGHEGERLQIFVPETMDFRDSIALNFSIPMDLNKISQQISLRLAGSPLDFEVEPIQSDRRLYLKPTRNLPPGKFIKIKIQGNKESDPLLLDRKIWVLKIPKWRMTLNGLDPEKGPIVFDKTTTTSINFVINGYEDQNVSAVKVEKLGFGPGRAINICAGQECAGKQAFSVDFFSVLPTVTGTNLFQLVTESGPNKKLHRQFFSYTYGPLAKGNRDSMIKDALKVYIDQESGLKTFATLLQSYTSQEFYMRFPGFNSPVNFDTVMNKRRNHTKWDGKECLLNTHRDQTDHGFSYLTSIGPFCGIPVEFSYDAPALFNVKVPVRIVGTSDLYFDSFPKVENPQGNTVVNFVANSDNNFDTSLEAKRFKGTYKIVVNIAEVIVNGRPGFNFLTEPLKGLYVFKGDFSMDAENHRYSMARSTLKFNEQGDIDYEINGFDDFDLRNETEHYLAGHGPSKDYYGQFIVKEWSQAAVIGKPKLVAKLTNGNLLDNLTFEMTLSALNQAMEDLKPLATNLMLGDLVSKVSPAVINRVIAEVRQGVELGLPDWAPQPLNDLVISASAMMGTDVKVVRPANGEDGGVLSSASCGVHILGSSPPKVRVPKGIQGVDSWITSETSRPPYGPGERFRNSEPGLLIAIKKDPINQGLYQIWKKGFASLLIDRAFAEGFKEETGETELLEIIDNLLKPKIFLAMLDPSRKRHFLPNGEEFLLKEGSEIKVHLSAITPPSIEISKSVRRPVVPSLSLSGEVELLVTLHSLDSKPIEIVRALIQAQSVAKVGFRPYSQRESYPQHGPVAFHLNISDKKVFLKYQLQVDEKVNPLSLDTREAELVLDSLVTSLFLPLVNKLMDEVPLPDLKGCGIQIDSFDFKPVPRLPTNRDPYMLAKVLISPYEFNGVCKL